jgi:hypothetical protein
MSGAMNIVLTSFGGALAQAGFLASISNPNGTDVDRDRLVIRNDVLGMSVTARTAGGVAQLTALKLPLTLDSITWQTAVADSSDLQVADGIGFDSGGNLVVAGQKYLTATDTITGYVAKFNSSGAIQWQQRINGRSAFFAVAIDSSDNIYCAGGASFFSSTRYDIYVAKFDASGTLQWRRNIGDTGTPFESAAGISINNDTWVSLAATPTPTNTDAAFLTITQSAGTAVSGSTQRDPGGSGRQEGIAVVRGEAAGTNYYMVNTYATLSSGSKSDQILIRQTNSSGFEWQRQLSGSTSVYGRSAAMDPSGTHVYTCAALVSSDGLRNELLLAKYATTGSLIWQRRLSCPTASLTANSIATDSLDNFYVCMSQTSSGLSSRALVLKMPGSGAGNGGTAVLDGRTYTYSESTISSFAGGLLSSSYNPANSEFTETTVTPTGATSSNTLAIGSQPI